MAHSQSTGVALHFSFQLCNKIPIGEKLCHFASHSLCLHFWFLTCFPCLRIRKLLSSTKEKMQPERSERSVIQIRLWTSRQKMQIYSQQIVFSVVVLCPFFLLK